MYSFSGPQSQFPLHVSVSDLHIPKFGPHIWLQQTRQTDPGCICIVYKSLTDIWVWELGDITLYFCFGNKETAPCTVSFLGIHKWEPDIYIQCSPALHLQCIQLSVGKYPEYSATPFSIPTWLFFYCETKWFLKTNTNLEIINLSYRN